MLQAVKIPVESLPHTYAPSAQEGYVAIHCTMLVSIGMMTYISMQYVAAEEPLGRLGGVIACVHGQVVGR